MIERFQNASGGRRLLIEALRTQPIIEGNLQTAEALAECATLVEYTSGETLFTVSVVWRPSVAQLDAGLADQGISSSMRDWGCPLARASRVAVR